MKKLLLGLILPLTLLAAQAIAFVAATYTVMNLNDSGPGSLREALIAANANKGSTVVFATNGTINLASPLPDLTNQVTIDGSTAPGFAGSPLVSLNFQGRPGLNVAAGADGTIIKSLSFVGAGSAALTLQASKVSVQGNFIGLQTNGAVGANFGDGVRILAPSAGNLIGNSNAVAGISYTNTSDTNQFTTQPVSGWQGLRNFGTNAAQFLICGTSGTNGLLYTGPIAGGGTNYLVQYPGTNTESTSVYGPDNLDGGRNRVVGSYKKSGETNVYNHGFVWEGTTSQLPTGGAFRTIDYPNAKYQYTHSSMGNLAVGNADGPKQVGKQTLPIGPGIAYIYDLANSYFATNVVYPKSKSTTAYGIWQNSPTSYTICGGYSPLATNNLTNQGIPLTQGKGYMVDYDVAQKKFSNWTSFDYPNGPAGVNFITHFEGVSSTEPGVYNLSANSVEAGSTGPSQGSWVSVRRNDDGTFDKGTWVDLDYPGAPDGIASSDSVYGNNVVGIVIGTDTFSYQATVNIAFRLSNVISGNKGNGISVSGSKGNIIAMNYIGTDAAGSTNATYGNGMNGILLTAKSSENLIGGQAAGTNNPTGSKKPANAVFQRPAQGNLISANKANGVLITGASAKNILSGNYIGTDASGTNAVGNALDGVVVEKSNYNSLQGCTLHQNPFVFYNVISGNGGHGVRVTSSDNVTVQANFLGMGADNATSVANGGDGLLVAGSSRNTQVGGVIPLGNVISGNSLHGIEVRDTVSNFISFNTFCGIAAFQTFASPNGLNGILVTSTGRNNTIRTCIVSGNNGNGIELGGNATGVQITDTSIGTDTNITAPLPNLGSGIVISGTAHGNAIGGFQPSVEPNVFVSGNDGYGIAVIDQAYNNKIYHTTVGMGAATSGDIPNGYGGILLDVGSSSTTIGGKTAPFQNVIQGNTDAGLYIFSSKKNDVIGNIISDNTVVGVYAFGLCTGTVIKGNTIDSNGTGGMNNVDLSLSKGIIYTP